MRPTREPAEISRRCHEGRETARLGSLSGPSAGCSMDRMRHWSRGVVYVGLGIALSALASCTTGGSERQSPAPNVMSPAPESNVSGGCSRFIIRADSINALELIELLGSHVPTWLPDGFGLRTAWRVGEGEGSHGGIWTDEGCRTVRFDLYPGGAAEESPRPDGRWVETDRYRCSGGGLRNVRCISYHAWPVGTRSLFSPSVFRT
jgi:hypothetical protein